MEKRIEAPEVKQPLKDSIDKLQLEQKHLKAMVEALKPLNLTGEALIFIKDGKMLVLPEKNIGQAEQLGRMSLAIDKKDVPELGCICCGRVVRKDVNIIDEFVLPSKILVTTNSPVVPILQAAINIGGNEGLKLLKANKSLILNSLADPRITMKDIINTPFEVVVHGYGTRSTKYYAEKVREAPGSIVFSVHTHPTDNIGGNLWGRPTAWDILHGFGANQFLEWEGIIGVERGTRPEEFRVSRENLSVFYSNINDITWARKGLRALEAEKNPKSIESSFATFSYARDFERTHKARAATYGELLKNLG